MLIDIRWCVLFLKLLESVTFPNVKKNKWNNREIMYWFVETNTQILIHSTIRLEIPKIHIFPKFLQNSRFFFYIN